MSSLALLLKALPSLWFFLKEAVVGKGRLGPTNANARAKTPWRLIVMILFLAMILFLNHTIDLTTKNEELEKRLKESEKPKQTKVEEGFTRDHLELRLCQQQNQTNLNDLRIAEADKDRLVQDVQKLTLELLQCKVPPSEKKPPVDKNKKAADRLEKLEDNEGGSK